VSGNGPYRFALYYVIFSQKREKQKYDEGEERDGLGKPHLTKFSRTGPVKHFETEAKTER